LIHAADLGAGTSSIIPARLIILILFPILSLYLFISAPNCATGRPCRLLAGRRNSIIRSRRVKVYFAKKSSPSVRCRRRCAAAAAATSAQHSQKRCLLIDAAPVSAVYCCAAAGRIKQKKEKKKKKKKTQTSKVVPTGLQSGESFGNQKAAGCQGNQNLGRWETKSKKKKKKKKRR
jgi:hypothetical protein